MSIKTNFLLLFTDLQARARNCFLSNINISLHKPRKAVVVSFSRLRLRWHSLLSALQRMQTVTLSFHDSVLHLVERTTPKAEILSCRFTSVSHLHQLATHAATGKSRS